jgi:hypothetical protein
MSETKKQTLWLVLSYEENDRNLAMLDHVLCDSRAMAEQWQERWERLGYQTRIDKIGITTHCPPLETTEHVA